MASNENLRSYASISENGSILLGKNTVADGYHKGRKIGVFTHIHHDHAKFFTNALHECSAVFVSRPTLDLLAAFELAPDIGVPADTYFKGRHVHGIDFSDPILPMKHIREPDAGKCYADQITLHQARHILGSAQVEVVADDGVRAVYSGDFDYPGTTPVRCDVLVLDSTHGNPVFNAPVDADSLEARLIECVECELGAGNPVVVRAHTGQLQHAMSLLSKALAPNVSFISPKKNTRLIPVYQKYGMAIREVIPSESMHGENIADGAFPFVEFLTINDSKTDSEIAGRSAVFQLGGINMGSRTTIRQNQNKQYFIELGQHATYDNILKYVKRCSPDLVVADSHRSAWGQSLAKQIRDVLGIDAIAEPERKQGAA